MDHLHRIEHPAIPNRKSSSSEEFQIIGTLNAAGNSTTKQDYQFTDDEISNSPVYYRLKIINTDNSFEYSKTIVVNGSSISSALQNISLPKSGYNWIKYPD